MTPEQYRRVKELFHAASEVPPVEREAWIAQQCDDATVRVKVLEMLAVEQEPSAADQFDGGGARLLAECTAAIDAEAKQTPTRIGPYRILHKLGQGGMGVVYAAEQENPRRDVALKVLPPGHVSNHMLQRFRREVELLGRLRHSGIAQVYEAGVAETRTDSGMTLQQPFFAMELVAGLPLDEFARTHDLDRAARLDLFARVCDAVQHAHSRDVIHRDLKPGNIFVESDGQPKILDFGVSRATDADEQTLTLQTSEGQLLGTVPYMSPEQVAGDPSKIDARSDVYSLGVVLFELLAERLPHDLRNHPIPEAVRIIRDEEPSRLGSINTHYRGDVETIVSKALEKDPVRRYRSAAELAADIRRYLHDQPIVARPPSASYRLRKFASRNKAIVGGIVATFLALTIGLIGMTQFGLREAAARRHSDLASYRASLAAAAAALRESDVASAERHLAEAPRDLRGWEWRHLHSQLDQSLRAVELRYEGSPHSSDLARGLTQAWFDESSSTLHVTRRPRIADRALRVESFDRTTLQRTSAWSVPDVRWWAPLPDGRALVSQMFSGETSIRDASTGSQQHETPPFSNQRHAIHVASAVHASEDVAGCFAALAKGVQFVGPVVVSHDGGWLAAVQRRGSGEPHRVMLFDVAHPEQPRSVGESAEGAGDLAFSPDDRFLAVAGHDRSLVVYDLEQNAVAWERPDAHTDAILTVAFRPDGQTLVSGGQDKVLRFWSASDGTPRGSYIGHRNPILEARFQPDGRGAISFSALELRSWIEPEVTGPVRQHEWFVEAVAVSPDGTLLAEGSRAVHLRDLASGRLVAAITPGASADPIRGLRFLDAHTLLIASGRLRNPQVFRFDLRTGAIQNHQEDYGAALESCFGKDGRLLHPEDGAGLDLRETETPAYVGVKQAGGRNISTPLGGRLAVSRHRKVWVYDLERSAAIWQGDTPGKGARVALFAEGRRLAIGFGKEVRVVDVDTGREIGILRGHTDRISRITTLPGQERLVTGSEDRTLRLWDLESMQEVAALRGHRDRVLDLAVTPDGSTIFSGAGDYTVGRWETRPAGELLQAGIEYDAITARLTPYVRERMRDDAQTAAERIEADETLRPREKQIALQILLRESVSGRSAAAR